MILKALSKHLVSPIKARSIVESCSLYGISVRRTEKTESVFLFIYETGYVFYAADVPVLEEH